MLRITINFEQLSRIFKTGEEKDPDRPSEHEEGARCSPKYFIGEYEEKSKT